MINIKRLSNNIPVILEEIDYLHSVSFGVYVKVGSAFETEKNNGISHMLEHMFFKSTKNRTAKDIANEMAYIGGSFNAFTEKEMTAFYVTVLYDKFYDAIALIGDMLANPSFKREELEKEKGIVQEEIDMYDDSADDLVHEMLQKCAWKDEPLGFQISGEKDNIRRFTTEDLFEYRDKMYTADRMVISVAGNFKQEEVMGVLEQWFSHYRFCTSLVTLKEPIYKPVFYQKEKDMEQVHLNIAFPCISEVSKEKYSLYLLSNILGGEDNSRLFQKLREEAGLTYSVYSYESLFEKAGMFHINAVLNPLRSSEVLLKIEEVVSKIVADGVTENELIQAKQQLKTDLVIGNESTKSRIYYNGKEFLLKGKIKTVDEICQEIYKIGCKDIKRFVDEYLDWNKKSVSLVGNIKDIK